MMISWEMVSCVAPEELPQKKQEEVGLSVILEESGSPGTNHRRRLLLVVRKRASHLMILALV